MGLLLGAQLLLLIGMGAVSAWGWKHVSPEARVAARLGTSGVDWTMSKRTTLLWTPAIGVFIVLTTVATRDSSSAESGAAVGLGLMVFFLAAHWWSVRRAAR